MKRTTRATVMMIVALFVAAEVWGAKTVDTTSLVVCGKTEQPTPCMLILNRAVPSYELTVKNEKNSLLTFKAERVEGAWQVLGQTRKERLIEVIVDSKDASYVVVNPRVPNIDKDLIPEGSDGLLIKTVEVRHK